MMISMSREIVEKLQFSGLYQLSAEKPCLSCKTMAVKPSMYRTAGLIGKGRFGRVYLVKDNLSGEMRLKSMLILV